MGFEKLPDSPKATVLRKPHRCRPPQDHPSGRKDKAIPPGSEWRCDQCGELSIADFFQTWRGALVLNVLSPVVLLVRALAVLIIVDARVWWIRKRVLYGVVATAYALLLTVLLGGLLISLAPPATGAL